jgi:hypothetical protein
VHRKVWEGVGQCRKSRKVKKSVGGFGKCRKCVGRSTVEGAERWAKERFGRFMKE